MASSTSSADSDTASIFSHASSSSSATTSSTTFPRNFPHGHGPRVLSATVTVHTSGNTQLILPRTLTRPKLKHVSPEAIAAVGDDLAGVPLPYIIQSLKEIGPRMMAALARTTAPVPASLPRELAVSVAPDSDPDPDESSATARVDPLPTHLLAVYARSSNGLSGAVPRRKVTLFPTHAIVLAAHCAHLPELPPGAKEKERMREDDEEHEGESEQHEVSQPQRDVPEPREKPPGQPTSITLPVVPLCIPAPPMFPVLQAYLYTKRADHLLGALIPNPQSQMLAAPARIARQSSANLSPPSTPTSSSSTSTLTPSTPTPVATPLPPVSPPAALIPDAYSLARQLSTLHTTQTLVRATLRTHALWANAAALGVFDERLWLTIDFAWRVLLGAMEQSQEQEDCGSDHKVAEAGMPSGDPEVEKPTEGVRTEEVEDAQ